MRNIHSGPPGGGRRGPDGNPGPGGDKGRPGEPGRGGNAKKSIAFFLISYHKL